MRLIRMASAKPGMVVGRALMEDTGRVLLQEGVVLSEAYIKALRMKGYVRLYVKDPDDALDVVLEEDVSPAVRARAFQTLHNAYASIENEVGRLRTETAKEIKDAMDTDAVSALMSEKGPLSHVHEVVAQILEEVLTRSTLAGLTSIKSADTQIFDHSIDVCAVAIMIGRTVGLDSARLRQLATGSLLHDIGAIFLEPHVQGQLRIIHHTKLGYELLKKSENADIMAPHVAYEHHEHQDGSGLPRGLRGSNSIKRDRSMPPPVPTLIGEIAAVANIYDNLLSGSEKYEPRTPDEALKTIRRAAGRMFNRSVVMAFLRVVPVYPQGTEVLVRTGDYRGFTGVVAKVNPAVLDKPLIILTLDPNGKRITPEELDLHKAEDVEIRCKGI